MDAIPSVLRYTVHDFDPEWQTSLTAEGSAVVHRLARPMTPKNLHSEKIGFGFRVTTVPEHRTRKEPMVVIIVEALQ